MNAQALHQLCADPGKIGQEDVSMLYELSEKFPWSQPIQILFTKGLHNTKSIAYLDQLKKTSAITADRSRLYHFILKERLLEKIQQLDEQITEELRKEEESNKYDQPLIEIPEPEIETSEKVTNELPFNFIPYHSKEEIDPYSELNDAQEEKPIAIITRDILEELIERKVKDVLPKSLENKESIPSVEDIPSVKIQDDVSSGLNFETKPEENSEEDSEEDSEERLVTIEEKKESQAKSELFGELEKEFLWQAVNASIQIDVMSDLEKLPEQEVKHPIPEADFSRRATKIDDHEFNWEKPHSFLNWLMPKNEEAEEEREPENFRPTKKDVPVEDLVDQFLKKDPKITPQKAEFYSPGNIAKLSISDNEDFVSETLASIYEKQGYYAKAIRVYEKLSLKNPQKSSFFASRIKELEALKNSKHK